MLALGLELTPLERLVPKYSVLAHSDMAAM